MNASTNYEFNLPEESDFAKITDLTDNWEAVDGIIHDHETLDAGTDDGAHGIRIKDKKVQFGSGEDWEDTLAKPTDESIFDLRSAATTVDKDGNGHTRITEIDSTNNATSVTTIVPTSDTVTTITQVITKPDVTHTKTTTITKTLSGSSISESYTSAPVE